MDNSNARDMSDDNKYRESIPKRPHAIALFSGGLDSTLSILLMLKQDIRVTALTFVTHFECGPREYSSGGFDPCAVAQKYGFDVKIVHFGEEFIDIVRNPRFGHGKNMNPCTDCRILMLREARKVMEESGADFIVTGEVLGQRPMSQLKDKLNLVVNQSGLKGKLLRPLSAKLLTPTDPELSGLVDRDQLEAINGRSRRRQMELAEQLGLESHFSPAGGCLLTDRSYSNKLRDLLAHSEHVTFDDFDLLRAGRHFRLDANTKLIVGRNEEDNTRILSQRQPQHVQLEALGVGSPIALLIGEASDENITKAARITARYTSARHQPSVEVTVSDSNGERTLAVLPTTAEEIGCEAVR